MSKVLAGMHVALISGFSDNGAFDPKRQENILEYVMRQNVTGLYVGGSSGEGALMSVAELSAQQEVVKGVAQDTNLELIAHVGLPSLRDSIELAKRAQSLGYHGLSALPPHAYPYSQEEIYEYYEVLAAATDLPMIVYEVPVRTGRPTPLDQMIRLLDLPNVKGIKYTSSDLFALAQLQKARPNSTYFFGFDEIISSALALGVDGGIGTTYNVLGSLYGALYEAAAASDMKKMQQLQRISQDYVSALLVTGVIPGTKLTLEMLGVDCGPARAPFKLRGEDPRKTLEAVISDPAFREWIV
ncbi:N-acetylneuraminate lyase [Rhodobacteraceae bacterium RKSG542]|uniref:dihydrodipicolinate synthase family protein n=1 Tax=Pseudovibrio flavus TaxID=2529854 RepID=UPI0012BC3A8F|nr:dihydrodipicolinate synthase family protein [Pseudovibrio flavus]MTI16466.1 N-acetylneuraminate lyase [Pseudovibrio flavus]